MIELFEQDIKTNDRQSSKGNQLKWEKDAVWYKADYTGYEGLAEYTISHLLKYSSLKADEYVLYTPVEIKYKSQAYRGVSSPNFLDSDWQIITLERLFKIKYGKSLNEIIWSTREMKDRISFLTDRMEAIGLKGFGKYINKMLTIDAFFLNEDRHTHNIAVLMNSQGDFALCPIFDNGAGLLADTKMDYPINADLYELIKTVKAKTFSRSFDEQLEMSELLYGNNLYFSFTKAEVEEILSLNGKNGEASIYPLNERIRVRDIIFEQMRKYSYLFSKKDR